MIIKGELSAKALLLKAGQKEVNDELGSLGFHARGKNMRHFLSFTLGASVVLALAGCAASKPPHTPPRLSDEKCDLIAKVLSIHYPMTRAEVDKKLGPSRIVPGVMISGLRWDRYWIGEDASVELGFSVRNHPKCSDDDWVNPPAYTDIHFRIDGQWRVFRYTLEPSPLSQFLR